MSSDHLKSIIETLRKVLDDASIAAVLNREKIRVSDGRTWTRQRCIATGNTPESRVLTPL